MCKLFLMSLILTSSLSLSFSTNNYNCKEENYLYELQLKIYDPDVEKFAEDGWEKLVAEGRTRGITDTPNYDVICAKVQVKGSERRYIIVVEYYSYEPGVFFCLLFVMTNQTKPMSISCYVQPPSGENNPAEQEEQDMFYFFYHNTLFCPRR